MTIKKHPAWKEALAKVVERVNNDGYGCFISHKEILEWLDLEEPTSVAGYKQFSLLLLSQTETLKSSLLHDHSIYLMNDRGKGYTVLTPDNQVVEGPALHMKKAMVQIRKATDAATHVDTAKLSAPGRESRTRNLSKLAFLTATLGSKRLSFSEDGK